MINAMAFALRGLMLPALAGTLFVDVAQVLFIKIDASSFYQNMPLVVRNIHIDRIIMQIPPQLLHLRRIGRPADDHRQVMTTIRRTLMTTRLVLRDNILITFQLGSLGNWLLIMAWLHILVFLSHLSKSAVIPAEAGIQGRFNRH